MYPSTLAQAKNIVSKNVHVYICAFCGDLLLASIYHYMHVSCIASQPYYMMTMHATTLYTCMACGVAYVYDSSCYMYVKLALL